jgi:hypothetical protein
LIYERGIKHLDKTEIVNDCYLDFIDEGVTDFNIKLFKRRISAKILTISHNTIHTVDIDKIGYRKQTGFYTQDRLCTCCRETLPNNMFYTYTDKKGIIRQSCYCTPCKSKKAKAFDDKFKKENPEKYKERQREYTKKHTDNQGLRARTKLYNSYIIYLLLRSPTNNYTREYLWQHPEIIQEKRRQLKLQRKTGNMYSKEKTIIACISCNKNKLLKDFRRKQKNNIKFRSPICINCEESSRKLTGI